MKKIEILLEIETPTQDAFELHALESVSLYDSARHAEKLVKDLAGFGLEVDSTYAPVPMFGSAAGNGNLNPEIALFSTPGLNNDLSATTQIVAAEVSLSKIAELATNPKIRVFPNSMLTFFSPDSDENAGLGMHTFDLASSRGGVDCRPFRPGVTVDVIRELLGVETVWRDGFRGQNVIVGVLDEGINGNVYPVVGGYSNIRGPMAGSAQITSHGSMCAADILVAAPAARLYDYPIFDSRTGGALQMFQQVLNQRRIDGTPHLTNNSYGFTGVPDRALFSSHETHDLDHPIHRKVREVVASGCATFFAAGNCGGNCPSGSCHSSGTGPGRSINASNSLTEVITVAAVNSRHERIGYSSQGPGMFERTKPDISAYSHFFGNFGQNRPGGTAQIFDNGTSAACPVATGVGALLLSVKSELSTADIKELLLRSATNLGSPGWDADTGYGVINAAVAYSLLMRQIGE